MRSMIVDWGRDKTTAYIIDEPSDKGEVRAALNVWENLQGIELAEAIAKSALEARVEYIYADTPMLIDHLSCIVEIPVSRIRWISLRDMIRSKKTV